jgi:hypothetical protein
LRIPHMPTMTRSPAPAPIVGLCMIGIRPWRDARPPEADRARDGGAGGGPTVVPGGATVAPAA